MNRINQPSGFSSGSGDDVKSWRDLGSGEFDGVKIIHDVQVKVLTNQKKITDSEPFREAVAGASLIPNGEIKTGGMFHSFFESENYFSMMQLCVIPDSDVEEGKKNGEDVPKFFAVVYSIKKHVQPSLVAKVMNQIIKDASTFMGAQPPVLVRKPNPRDN